LRITTLLCVAAFVLLARSAAAQDVNYDYDQRNVSVFGRYWFASDWAVSAESLSREPTGLLRLQDFRIGVQRRF
jgi:hypothetical protein